MCRDISKLPENILRNGEGGLVVRRPSSDSSPKNRGEELATSIFPNSPRGGVEGEGEI